MPVNIKDRPLSIEAIDKLKGMEAEINRRNARPQIKETYDETTVEPTGKDIEDGWSHRHNYPKEENI